PVARPSGPGHWVTAGIRHRGQGTGSRRAFVIAGRALGHAGRSSSRAGHWVMPGVRPAGQLTEPHQAFVLAGQGTELRPTLVLSRPVIELHQAGRVTESGQPTT